MWYEIIPSAAIVTLAVSVPTLTVYGINYLFLGKPIKRSIVDRTDCLLFMRDHRISGFGHKTIGLEGIPDAPQHEKKN